MTDGTVLSLDNPAKLPAANKLPEIREPVILATILTPPDYVGNIITLGEEKRGAQQGINYLGSQVQITYELPMAEVVLDFFDRLKRSEEHTSELPSLMRNSYADFCLK